MKSISATFVTSAVQPSSFPEEDLCDVAVAGRSNVGKSSLINCLLVRHQLARISRTPGMTRALNFYRIEDRFYLVDLPGYGFARRTQEERQSWKRMVESYLGSRRGLVAMLVLVDLRRGPEPEEYQLLDLLRRFGIRAVVVFTKSDKLSKSARNLRFQQLAATMRDFAASTVLFSSKSGEGRENLWNIILRLISEPSSP
ncbi:MAG: YihA family ribosome biogenesis GTP-binding protein [Bradymonadales bacterium]|nr:YihA family ribosome biogenesis GTP-binding protein [Bradymonadales bacterium]